MRRTVEITEVGQGSGPRVLLLPGLGARGSGFRLLAEELQAVCRPVLVEYPEGPLAGVGAAALARQVREAAGAFDAAVGSSFGGMVCAQLAHQGAVRGAAFLGSFTRTAQLGLRGRCIVMMGPIAELGRPGALAAAIAANQLVPQTMVPHVVPTTSIERRTVVHRAWAIHDEAPPESLRDLPISCVAIHGERDWLVPVSVLPRLATALPPGTPTHVLEGAGHVPYVTHPRACAELLAPWIAGLARQDEAAQTAA